jgi:hypothetical protein
MLIHHKMLSGGIRLRYATGRLPKPVVPEFRALREELTLGVRILCTK